MKKSNNRASQHKIKRALKNKKRIINKPRLSKFERKQEFIRSQIISSSLKNASQQF